MEIRVHPVRVLRAMSYSTDMTRDLQQGKGSAFFTCSISSDSSTKRPAAVCVGKKTFNELFTKVEEYLFASANAKTTFRVSYSAKKTQRLYGVRVQFR